MIDEVALEEEFAKVELRRATLGRLLSYFAPYKRQVAAIAALEVVWVISMIADPALIAWAIDGPIAARDASGAWGVGGLLAINILFRMALTMWELRIVLRVGVDALHDIRKEVFDHVQRLSMRYFDRTKQGRIIARADRDVDTLEHLLVWGPVVFVSLVVMMVLAFGQIVLSFGDVAVWVLAAVPAVLLTTRLFERFGFPAYRQVRETQSRITAHVAETITGVRVVKAFSAEGREMTHLGTLQGHYHQAVMHAVRVVAGYIPSLSLTFHGLMLVILAVGGAAVVRGDLGPGELLELVMLIGFVLGPVEGLGQLYNECLRSGAAAERIFLLLDTEPEVRDGPDALDPGRIVGEVVFDHVSFSYDPQGESYQLDDVSFRVSPGATVALVGHTGAGKTSIVNLVARFYEAQQGAVRIDGQDVRTIPLDALHAQTGMVLQENFLFAGSVLENLRFVAPDLTEEGARRGFTDLGCEAILDQLVDGLGTDVGERGANLSEGERQVVCFVRALLAGPSILVLDEATSAVDTRTEALILRALRRLSARQTTFIVAHRLSTIRHADQILVLERGKLVERGTHRELIDAGGTYAGLYREYAT